MNFPLMEHKNLDNEIHIWLVDLDQLKMNFEHPEYTLPKREREKAKRLRFETHRKRYIHGHFLLRILIGRYLGDDFYDQDFYYNDHGKPSLEQNTEKIPFHFNLSNSENVFVFAFAKDADIGVDVERIQNLSDMDDIAERFFSRPEKERYRLSHSGLKKTIFFKFWTRKEALLKAIGTGLLVPPDQVTVISGDSEASPDIVETHVENGKAVDHPGSGSARRFRICACHERRTS